MDPLTWEGGGGGCSPGLPPLRQSRSNLRVSGFQGFRVLGFQGLRFWGLGL